ncbi:MAG: ATP-binding cassette domain-containing protein [Bacteroidia bacterium]|nr:ATP-binding cassette domain-containing protein [Bacteroidia bacterium]
MELREIYHSFPSLSGRVHALQGVSAELPSKGIVGLLGPNGSGKTTLLRIIMGIISPESGEIWYKGQPLSKTMRLRFGYMPEERGLYPKMTARSQLFYLLRLRGMSPSTVSDKIAYWVKRLEMPWIDRPARSLSKGMQQKVQLVLALEGDPPVLLLDEPFSGLDPIVSTDIEALLREKAQKDTLIILSTHRLEQVDHLCDYVLLIHKGRLVLAGETDAIRRRFWSHTYEIEIDRLLEQIQLPEGVKVAEVKMNRIYLTLSENLSGQTLLEALLPQAEIRFFAQKLPTIRDIFLQVVGEA